MEVQFKFVEQCFKPSSGHAAWEPQDVISYKIRHE